MVLILFAERFDVSFAVGIKMLLAALVGVFGDVEILLNDPPGIGQEGQCAPAPLRYSLVSVMVSVVIVNDASHGRAFEALARMRRQMPV